MIITKEKLDALAERMKRCSLREQDLIEKFILGSGKGGQKINKTASCVYLKHRPTGIEVKCQRERSRALNRYIARSEMCEKLESKNFFEKSEKQMAMEKIRRQKRRRTRRQQEKTLAGKKLRSALKISRRPPDE